MPVINERDKKIIRKISEKYHVRRVLLFGSSASPDTESRDIDIAVEGVPTEQFYDFYGDLMLAVSKPIDVIDLSGTSMFIKMIQQEGIVLYG